MIRRIIILALLAPGMILTPKETRKAEAILHGIILDKSTDEPLVNAVVRLIEADRYDVANERGEFEFQDLPLGEYTLEVSYLGYRSKTEKIVLNKNIVTGVVVYMTPVPIETGAVVISESGELSRYDELKKWTGVLRGKELDRDMGNTLAATLKNETGIAMRTMGPAPARPVIRGLGSSRVQITENGITQTDLSASSPDHAVAIEPFNLERIEVIRGPETVLSSSSTFGGLVNIKRNDISPEAPKNFGGSLGLYGESANKGYLGSGSFAVPLSDFALRGDYSYRDADNLTTPIGELKNSGLTTRSAGGGISYVHSLGYAGFGVREFKSDYGIPGGFVGAHPDGVNISMLKRNYTGRLFYRLSGKSLRSVQLDLSREYYSHTEYEAGGFAGSEYVIYNYQGRADLNTRNLLFFEKGTVGISYERRDFNIGAFVFTAPTLTNELSAYFYQTASSGKFSFQAGGRYSYSEIKPRRATKSTRESFLVNRHFNIWSLSLSTAYEINASWLAGVNVSRSSRVPAAEELYTEGPHLAAYSYETGNPLLEDEKGIGSEIFGYYKSPVFNIMATVFYNDFGYYIIPRNSGRINPATILPVYVMEGVRARFYGIEAQTEIKINNGFQVTGNTSYTVGRFKESGLPLPAIPPLKGRIELKYTGEYISGGFSAELAAAQNDVDKFEEPTAGYAVFNIYLQKSFTGTSVIHNVSLSMDNIFNKEYRNHLSRVKSIMPEGGRNLRLTYRVFFNN